MATNQKIRPCPRCGNGDMSMFCYEPGNWHVECEDCNYLGPASGSQRWAIKLHNEAIAKAALSASPSPRPPSD